MIRFAGFIIAAIFLASCTSTEVKPAPRSGPITTDAGGAPGYQHGMDKSKFAIGANRHDANEFGFIKVVGSEGTFAVDAKNGLAVAIPNASRNSAPATKWYTHEPDEHNQLVMDYFTGAGIPKEQVGGIHATMSMAASANGEQSPAAPQQVVGYQSVLDRKAGDIPVIDSVAWARMNDKGEVLTEWVYWPAIPGKIIEDARRLQAMLLKDSDKKAFLAKLPPGLPPGNVAIRHSSATSEDGFEAFASYDVFEHRSSPSQSTGQQIPTRVSRSISITRHFEVNGRELKLPQEKPHILADFPTAIRPAPNRPAAQ